MHVLTESVERRRFIYPDGFRSVDTMELVCSCGEVFTADPDVTVAAVWDTFEAHRKEASTVRLVDVLEGLYNLDNTPAGPSVERGYN